MHNLEPWQRQMCQVLIDYGAPFDSKNYPETFELKGYASLIDAYKGWQFFYYKNCEVYHLISDYQGNRFVLDLVEDEEEFDEADRDREYRDRAEREAFDIIRRLAKKEAEIDAGLPTQLVLAI